MLSADRANVRIVASKNDNTIGNADRVRLNSDGRLQVGQVISVPDLFAIVEAGGDGAIRLDAVVTISLVAKRLVRQWI